MFDTASDTYTSGLIGVVTAVLIVLVLRPPPTGDPLYDTMTAFATVVAALFVSTIVFVGSNALLTHRRR